MGDVEGRQRDDACPIAVDQCFAVGGRFALENHGFRFAKIKVEVEAVSLLGRYVANEKHDGENPSRKQEHREGSLANRQRRCLITVCVENAEIQHEQADHAGDFFSIVVVRTKRPVEGLCVDGNA